MTQRVGETYKNYKIKKKTKTKAPIGKIMENVDGVQYENFKSNQKARIN